MAFAHMLYIILPDCPKSEEKCSSFYHIFPTILIGVFYAFYAAVLWPCIPL